MIKSEDIISMLCKECGISRDIKTLAYLSKAEAMTVLVYIQKLKSDLDDKKERAIPISEIISLVREELKKDSKAGTGNER